MTSEPDIKNEVATELSSETKIEAVEEPIKVEEPTKNEVTTEEVTNEPEFKKQN